MTDIHKKIRPGFRTLHLYLGLGAVIPIVMTLGMVLAYPFDSPPAASDEPMLPTPTGFQSSDRSFPNWLFHGTDAGLSDRIQNSNRTELFEPSAFKRIAKVHQILSTFHSGLSVEDEEKLSGLIYRESLRYGYDPELIVSLIMTESSFYKWAYSRKGAIGLMQINPLTGRELARINQISLGSSRALYDPNLNVRFGIQYLAQLHERFGDLGLALAAYNYGPTRISQWMERGERLPPGYSQKILRQYKQLLRDDPIAMLPPSPDSPS